MALPAAAPPCTSRVHRRAARRARAVAGILAATALLGVGALGCSAGDTSSAEPATGEVTTPDGRPVPPAPPPEPDALPNPGVEPGECVVVTYTPEGALAAQEGELCRPEQDQRDVAVLIVHGGGGYSGSWHGMRPWAERLLAEGYVTFTPGYTLFREGVESPVFPRPEQDVKAAVQYVRGTGNALGIRKDRIVVQGHSAGARLGAVAYATGGDDWFTGPGLHADIADTVDGFIGFYHPYDGTMSHDVQYYGGGDNASDPAVLERWRKADAIANAGGIEGPALLITGSRDWDQIEVSMTAFCAAITAADQSCEEVVIEGGGHGFDQGSATRLSRLGEESASVVLRWLNDQFPQDPPRDAQSADVDLDRAPTNTGQTPTTLRTRPTTTTPSGGGGAPQTSTTTPSSTTPTTAPAPSTTEAPPTTAPPPPTTDAPPTTPPPTTAPPPTSSPPPPP